MKAFELDKGVIAATGVSDEKGGIVLARKELGLGIGWVCSLHSSTLSSSCHNL